MSAVASSGDRLTTTTRRNEMSRPRKKALEVFDVVIWKDKRGRESEHVVSSFARDGKRLWLDCRRAVPIADVTPTGERREIERPVRKKRPQAQAPAPELAVAA